MGFIEVPSQPSQGKRLRDRQSPGLGLVLVVVVLVVILLLMATLTRTLIFNDDDGPPETIQDGVLVIEGDVVWEGRTGMMDTPVEVRRGGSLTIRDCDLQVPLEPLVVGYHQWFEGYPGSEIVVEDSNITIMADPNLDDITFLDVRHQFSDDYGASMAMIWRAVNLQGTERPALTFDVNTLGRFGDLMVTIQPSPDEGMQAFRFINFYPGNEGGWNTYQLDLSNYTGTVVGLSLSVVDESMDGMLLKDVRVTDDGADPPGDAFPTGNPMKDRWNCTGIEKLTVRIHYSGFQNLFTTEGNIRFTRSTLSSPHLSRDTDASIGQVAKTRLASERVGFNTMVLSRGGNVHAWAGRVLIQDCAFDNVTVEATQSNVVIERSEVVADREQVTLFRCWGSLVDCTFRSAFGRHSDLGSWMYPGAPNLWSVSLWGYADNFWGPDTMDPFVIAGCEFRDSLMGLDLAHTRVRLEDSTFTNISWIAIWDHETQGLGSWEEVVATNGFHDCRDAMFFQTHDCNILFHHDDRSFEDWDGYFRSDGFVTDSDGGGLPTGSLLGVWKADADMYMPTTIVNSTGWVIRPEWIELRLSVDWAGVAVERIPTDAVGHIVDFTGRNEDGGYWTENNILWPFLTPGSVESLDVGRVVIGIEVWTAWNSSSYIHAPVRDLEVEVRMDGDLLRTVDVEDEGVLFDEDYFRFNVSLDLPIGHNMVNFSLTADLNDTGDRIFLDGFNYSIARANVTTPIDDIAGWGYFTVLVLDPDTEFTVGAEELPLDDQTYFRFWRILLLEGSVLTIRDIPSDRLDGVDVRAKGSGGVVLEGLELTRLNLEKDGGWARLSNVTTDFFDVKVSNSDILMENCSGVPDWWFIERSTVRLVGCQLDLSWSWSWDTSVAVVTFIDCDLQSDMDHFHMKVGNGEVRFIDTRFVDIDLSFDIGDSINGTLEVRGCDLRGESAFMVLSSREYSWPRPSGSENKSRVHVSGNTFTGPNAGISAESWLFEEAISGNVLEDGAIYRVWYNNTPKLVPANESTDRWSYWMHPHPKVRNIFRHELFWSNDERLSLLALDTTDVDTLSVPPVLPMIITYDGGVYWFADIDMGIQSPTIIVPDWGDPMHRLLDLLTGKTDSNFWED